MRWVQLKDERQVAVATVKPRRKENRCSTACLIAAYRWSQATTVDDAWQRPLELLIIEFVACPFDPYRMSPCFSSDSLILCFLLNQ